MNSSELDPMLIFRCPECPSLAEICKYFKEVDESGHEVLRVKIRCLSGHADFVVDFSVIQDYLQAHNYQ